MYIGYVCNRVWKMDLGYIWTNVMTYKAAKIHAVNLYQYSQFSDSGVRDHYAHSLLWISWPPSLNHSQESLRILSFPNLVHDVLRLWLLVKLSSSLGPSCSTC
jgi:hypothetical protein